MFAILLALSRVPGVEGVLPWMVDFFYKGLVIHVVFSLAIWPINVIAFVVTYATCEIAGARFSPLGRIGQGFVLVAFPCLFAPAFFPSAEPRLVNYIPLIGHPLYDIGLVLLALGVLMPVARLFANLPGSWSRLSPLGFAAAAIGVIYVVALINFAIAGLMLALSGDLSNAREQFNWGGGHVLQFANAALMLTNWAILAQLSFGEKAFDAALFKLALGLVAAFVLPTLAFYFVFDPFGGEAARGLSFPAIRHRRARGARGHFRTQRRAEIWAVEDVALARSGLRRARNFDCAVRRRRRDGACDHRLRYAHARALSRRGDGGLGVEHGAAAHLRPQNARPRGGQPAGCARAFPTLWRRADARFARHVRRRRLRRAAQDAGRRRAPG